MITKTFTVCATFLGASDMWMALVSPWSFKSGGQEAHTQAPALQGLSSSASKWWNQAPRRVKEIWAPSWGSYIETEEEVTLSWARREQDFDWQTIKRREGKRHRKESRLQSEETRWIKSAKLKMKRASHATRTNKKRFQLKAGLVSLCWGKREINGF